MTCTKQQDGWGITGRKTICCSTVTATDGQTGLEKARSLIPDLIAGYTERHGVQSSGLLQQCKGKATP